MFTLSDADFSRLTKFMQSQYGINLTQKRQLITSRLSTTLQAKGYDGFTPFIDDLLRNGSKDDMELLLNKLTTNYTYFMREKEHYDFFQKVILPELVKKHEKDKVLAIWSAGCSSGEEPYNISMYIKEYLGSQANKWDTRLLATDISQRALALAKEGKYSLPDDVPDAWKRRYFTKESDEVYRVTPEIRSNVLFRTFNLMDPIRFKLKFDLIFCRNVMIYFDQPTKDALVQRFYDATRPGGYLLIGHSETISKSSPYQTLMPATYQRN